MEAGAVEAGNVEDLRGARGVYAFVVGLNVLLVGLGGPSAPPNLDAIADTVPRLVGPL